MYSMYYTNCSTVMGAYAMVWNNALVSVVKATAFLNT